MSFREGRWEADNKGPTDLEDDVTAGFDLISTWDLDEHGVDWITKKIKARVGTGPVVISLDVDVMDPSMVPASTSSLLLCDSLYRVILPLRILSEGETDQ